MGQEPGPGSVPRAGKPPPLSTQAHVAAADRHLPKFYSVTSEPSEVKRSFLTTYYVFLRTPFVIFCIILLAYQDSIHCLSMPFLSKDASNTILMAIHSKKKEKLKITSKGYRPSVVWEIDFTDPCCFIVPDRLAYLIVHIL